MALFGLLRRHPHERTGFELYGAAVQAAREPAYYLELGVADSTAGRFELVSAHVALLIRRLRRFASPEGDGLAQAVFDAMFSDMDVNLREMGVGDLGVGKRVRFLWESFHGRAEAYGAALDSGDAAGLAAALGRNVWAGTEPPAGAPEALAARMRAMAAVLEGQPLDSLLRGQARFA